MLAPHVGQGGPKNGPTTVDLASIPVLEGGLDAEFLHDGPQFVLRLDSKRAHERIEVALATVDWLLVRSDHRADDTGLAAQPIDDFMAKEKVHAVATDCPAERPPGSFK